MYKNKELRPPVTGDWDDTALLEKTGRIFNNITGPVDPDLVREQMIGYYACITHVDHQIGRILMALIENKLMDNTIILFTSDHGEMLSDHGLDRKSVPYQGSIRVPMILSGPENLLGRRWGEVDDTLVELRDVMPTMLDIAGAAIPATLDGQTIRQGHSRQWLHGEHVYGEKSHQFIVTKTDKYIWFSQTGEEQYFDLVKDPSETHNAIADPQYAQRIAELRGHLIQELAGCEEGYSDGEKLIVGCTPRECLSNATLPNC